MQHNSLGVRLITNEAPYYVTNSPGKKGPFLKMSSQLVLTIKKRNQVPPSPPICLADDGAGKATELRGTVTV